MSTDIALRVEGLSKRYLVRHSEHDHTTLAQAALHRARNVRSASRREEFWALKDVSFEISRGEVLGVIGHNGAGKSTLLKILSRITPPTSGRVDVFGRIGSLLEVGTGFHPELTGRENVYLNGSILGMKRRDIERHFDAIVDFSGVEKFLDTPVKRYSSGMYVRLAFAVAAHLETEILLLDEILAVGDSAFQQRSLSKMGEIASDGRVVVLVSHNEDVLSRLASTCIWLDKGMVCMKGDRSILRQYRVARTPAVRNGTLPHVDPLSISKASVADPAVRCGEPLTIDVTIASAEPIAPASPFLSATIRDLQTDRIVGHLDSRTEGKVVKPGSSVRFVIKEPPLLPGHYSVSLFVQEHGRLFDSVPEAIRFQVTPPLPYNFAVPSEAYDLAPVLWRYEVDLQ
ncbi:MAG: ABC transporter ATP-binding protein [Thermomicrobiales bacterium]